MVEFCDYRIAGSKFRVYASKEQMAVYGNLAPFAIEASSGASSGALEEVEPLFSLKFDCIVPGSGKQLYASDEYFFKLIEVADGYKVVFTDMETGRSYGMYFDADYKEFITDMSASEASAFVLNNMLMLSYTFATISRKALMIHASVAVVDGKGYLFLGKSGTGKSTHCRLWLKNIEGADILNDDNPVLKVEEDGVYVYGSAWSGKGCVYKNERYPVGGIARLAQAPYNKMERKSGAQAFGLVYTACSKLPLSSAFMSKICSTLGTVIASVPVYFLECLPDDAAAKLSFSTMASFN